MAAEGWQADYKDPLRWRFPNSKADLSIPGAAARVDKFECDFCTTKIVVMHKPTSDPAREKTKEYPFSSYLDGKKRLWEMRFQLRFKKVPDGQLFFGVELGRYVSLSTITKQAQKALVASCSAIVGDCYHSNGDNPKKTLGEAEPPTFVMPLWAFDQFHVAKAGEEPDMTGDLTGVGKKRSDDVGAYIKAMKAAIAGFSEDNVYTFCFWGISQFLDGIKWEAKADLSGGFLPAASFDFNGLCGSPPVYLTVYELSSGTKDSKHYKSAKKDYFRVAVWSALKPPLDDWAEEPEAEAVSSADVAKPVVEDQNLDLLGLSLDDPAPAAKGGYGASAPQAATPAESVDLLGEFQEANASKPPAKPQENMDLLGLM